MLALRKDPSRAGAWPPQSSCFGSSPHQACALRRPTGRCAVRSVPLLMPPMRLMETFVVDPEQPPHQWNKNIRQCSAQSCCDPLQYFDTPCSKAYGHLLLLVMRCGTPSQIDPDRCLQFHSLMVLAGLQTVKVLNKRTLLEADSGELKTMQCRLSRGDRRRVCVSVRHGDCRQMGCSRDVQDWM